MICVTNDTLKTPPPSSKNIARECAKGVFARKKHAPLQLQGEVALCLQIRWKKSFVDGIPNVRIVKPPLLRI